MTATLTSARPFTATSQAIDPQPSIVLPEDLLNRYVSVAMSAADPRQVEGQWYCALQLFSGVWAQGDSLKQCLDTLEEVLREWIYVKLINGDTDLPVVDEIDLTAATRRF